MASQPSSPLNFAESVESKDSSSSPTKIETSQIEVDDEYVDPRAERKLKLKLDFFILPLLCAVYFFAAMGRSDLANAEVAGLTDELNLSPKTYSLAASILVVSYVIFQFPGTLLLKQIGPPLQFGCAMVLWGTFTILMITIKNDKGLIALRFMIGLAEAFVQGAVFYLSFWYEYKELATRGAVFWSMSTFAGAFNGLIAYGITANLDGARGWRAWRWIFLIEGILPIAMSIPIFLLMPSSPYKVKWGFSAEEKRRLIRRSENAHNTRDAKLEIKKVPVVLASVHFWLFLVVACGGHFCLAGITNFLPSLIKGFGYTSVNAELFTVIAYACAAVGVFFWARIADKTNSRGFTLAASTVGAIIGYAILIGATNRNVLFFGTCLVTFSVYPNLVLQLSWAATAFVGYTRRGSALAFFNVFANLVAIGGNSAYTDPPYYRKGNISALAMSVLTIVFSLILRWYLGYLNEQKRKALAINSEETQALRRKGLEELGDRHPDFFYTL